MNVVEPVAPLHDTGAVDDTNPWLGLASFTEDTRRYFYGRDEEIAELSRRVQRKLLTVLFGKSGLGKTSILRAGLVPRLRIQGYCPVYVRVDYAEGTPEPSEQIKQAIHEASTAGRWTQVGSAVQGESLWEFLHHRDDVLRDNDGKTLIPLLIFDQFEEIFTLAQGDESGRARAARFLEHLADLVENRPPKVLEARLDADDEAASQFDFARGDYRVLIALREDYLAQLESLRSAMPSVSQNRLRIAPMTGQQALAAVLEPGKRLVSQEVAEAIVRFVAGGAEIANAEVEPALLSLICRELNDTRVAAGNTEITQGLLAGSHASILSNFYERALADQPPAVRRIVEDDLLTESGFRENVAEEKLLARFVAAGVPRAALAALVNRRLLRVEERLDIRRVELTHDVLCAVVKASRDQRHEREAREATEQQLADQRAREHAARKALVRARQIAAGCIVLAVLAVAAAVFATFSLHRARQAEHLAQQTRAQSEQTRDQAERLLGYLSEDFGRDLESFGELKTVAEFAQRQIDYFHGLPPQLKSPQSLLNGAIALVRHGRTMRLIGDAVRSRADDQEAIGLLQARLDAGDRSATTTVALGMAYTELANLEDSRDEPAGPADAQRALALLRPEAQAADATADARLAYADALIRRGWEQNASSPAEAVKSFEEAKRVTEALGAISLSNVFAATDHADADGYVASALMSLGRLDAATAAGQSGEDLARRVLVQRPGNRQALHAEAMSLSYLMAIPIARLDPAQAVQLGPQALKTGQVALGLDPDNAVAVNNLGVGYENLAAAYWRAGQLRQAAVTYRKAADTFGDLVAHTNTVGGANQAESLLWSAEYLAQMGDLSGLQALAADDARFLTLHPPTTATVADTHYRHSVNLYVQALIAEARGDPAAARRLAAEAAAAVTWEDRKILTSTGTAGSALLDALVARTAFRMGDFPAALHALDMTLATWSLVENDAPDDLDLQRFSALRAIALGRAGRTAEAIVAAKTVLAAERRLASLNRTDRLQPYELALALYADALAEPANATANLTEAAKIMDSLQPQVAALMGPKELRGWIRQAQARR
jgi:hypothetical protein